MTQKNIKRLAVSIVLTSFTFGCGKPYSSNPKNTSSGNELIAETPETPAAPEEPETPEVPRTPETPETPTEPSVFRIDQEAEKFKTRYGVTDVYTKIVDNKGKGDANLWGARNMRVVLHGVMYRGGANNLYFDPPRSNTNPLPTKGIQNLCEEDFSTGVYLYSTNYSTAPKSLNCKNTNHQDQNFQYKHISPASKPADILDLLYKRIKGQLNGPVYSHCWNGWHYSGLMAAIALKQFCGWSNSQLDAYWIKNTDGNSSGYESLRNKFKNFTPLPQYAITNDEKEAICLKP